MNFEVEIYLSCNVSHSSKDNSKKVNIPSFALIAYSISLPEK